MLTPIDGDYSRFHERFPSPWLDLATRSMPTTHTSVLDWCEYLWNQQPVLQEAYQRVIGYFRTEIEIDSKHSTGWLTTQEKDKCLETFEQMELLRHICTMLNDHGCYGNSFVTLLTPTTRILVCPRCGSSTPIADMAEKSKIYGLRIIGKKFHARCLGNCHLGSGYDGPFIVDHLEKEDDSNLKLIHWSPKFIEIQPSIVTGECDYYWRIQQELVDSIKRLNPLDLSLTPWSMLEAILEGLPIFKFRKDSIFHMKDPCLAGLPNGGWGIGRVIRSYRELWGLQLYKCHNEALCVDYVIPTRFITPDLTSGSSGGSTPINAYMSEDLADFQASIDAAQRTKRVDPAAWHFLPFPIRSTILGGDAKSLIMPDMQQAAVDSVLNANGIPVQFYRGDLQLQTAGVSLRLFEASQYQLTDNISRFLRWLAYQLFKRRSWPLLKLSLRRGAYADNIERLMMKLQLAQSQWLSREEALKDLSVDSDTQRRQIQEEAKLDMKMQQQLAEEAESASFGQTISQGVSPLTGAPAGQAAPGGQPAAQGAPGAGTPAGMAAAPGMTAAPQGQSAINPNQPMSPDELMAAGEAKAQELFILEPSQRNSELRALKQANEGLWMATKKALDDLEYQAQRAGGEMLKQQQRQAAGGM